MQRHPRRLAAAVSVLAIGLCHQAWASGFALRENSAITTGDADSGMASGAEDLSTITTNPAGMVYFNGSAASANLFSINPSGHVHVSGATTTTPLAPLPEHGGDGRDPNVSKFVPSAYFLTAPTDDLRLGLGISVPFGLVTNYSSDSAVRYQALFSSIEAIEFTPSIAYRATPWLSLGGSLAVQEVKVHLSNAIDFGTLVPLSLLKAGLLAPASAGAALAAGSGTTANDGRANLQGSAWSTGFTLGAIVEPMAGTRIGLAYHSEVKQKIVGSANFSVPAQYQPILAASGQFTNTTGTANLTLPGNIVLGVTQQVNAQWQLNAVYQWTNWSKFQQLRVDFANANQAPVINPYNFRNASFVAIGGSFKFSDNLTLRSGVAYDETPTVDGSRDLRVPDSNRYWVSTGMTYQLTSTIAITGAYQHLFFDAAPINHAETVTAGVVNTIVGTTSTSADIYAASVSARF